MESKDLITAIGIILTFALGIFNLINHIKSSRKTQFINTITTSRIKWINELRGYISQFISYLPLYRQQYVAKSGKERGEYINRLIELREKIKLHLNHNGDKDKEIIDLVNKLVEGTIKIYDECVIPVEDHLKNQKENAKNGSENHSEGIYKPKIERDTLDNLRFARISYRQHKDVILVNSEMLVSKTQEYLKGEWERVKLESKSGDLSDIIEKRIWISIIEMKHFNELKNWVILKFIYDLKLIWKLLIILSIVIIIIA